MKIRLYEIETYEIDTGAIDSGGPRPPDQAEIEDYIARGWLTPERDDQDYILDDTDIARIRLIRDLRMALAVETGEIDIILSLIDQLHTTRTTLACLHEAMCRQPESVQDNIRQTLAELSAKRA